MNTGYIVAVIGVLGVIAGALLYEGVMVGEHHTIGLAGIGLGIVLILIGLWLSRSGTKAAAPAPVAQS